VLTSGAALYLNHIRIATEQQTAETGRSEEARKKEEQRLADEAARKKKEEQQRLAGETARKKPRALANPAALSEVAPRVYRARFETSKGPFVIQVQREFAPQGADRFFNLVKNGFYDDVRFFRVLRSFLVQFGINGDPAISARWQVAWIPDDPSRASNGRGFISFVQMGANTRATQVFINLKDNSHLDQKHSPFGQVVSGMNVVDALFAGYADGAPGGPEQSRILSEGNAYLIKNFPQLDFIRRAAIEK
jgi:peptidyl-prolyl cis-trans isomerase A (cyclophilin A)